MLRYPPSTIQQIPGPAIYTENPDTSHGHNTTPPPVQAPYPLHTYTTNTTATKTQTYVQHPILSSTNPPLHPRRPEPNTYTSHILHQLLTSHAPHTSITRQLRETQYLNHVYHTHAPHSPHLIHPPHQNCRQPHTITLSQQIHMQHKQQYTHQSHIGYHDNLTDRPKTTT